MTLIDHLAQLGEILSAAVLILGILRSWYKKAKFEVDAQLQGYVETTIKKTAEEKLQNFVNEAISGNFDGLIQRQEELSQEVRILHRSLGEKVEEYHKDALHQISQSHRTMIAHLIDIHGDMVEAGLVPKRSFNGSHFRNEDKTPTGDT
jgi:hypothetical protein